MNKRFLGVLIFAFVVASVASLMLYRLLVKRGEPTQAAAPVTTQIVVATKDLDVGTLIKLDDVKLADWSGPVPAGAVLKLDGPEGAVGRGVNTAIVAKEPVLKSRLALDGAGGGLAAKIPPGKRAVAIRVNEVTGVSGFVSTGMHVDVLISGSHPNGNNSLGTIAKTVTTLEDLEVLSAGQELKKDAENKPVMVATVNLLVSPEQAEQLSLASSMNIQLVLRNPLDRDIAKTPGASTRNLFDGGRLDLRQSSSNSGDSGEVPRPAKAPVRLASARAVTPVAEVAPKKQPEPPVTMEIVSGTKKTEVKFSGEGK